MLRNLDNDKSKLVIDLSCRKTGEQSWHVAMNKWQKITDMEVNQGMSFLRLPLFSHAKSPFRTFGIGHVKFPLANLFLPLGQWRLRLTTDTSSPPL